MLGRAHPTIRRLRALRRDPRQREAEGVFLAEGTHLAEEALRAGAPVELALVSLGLDRTVEGRHLRARLASSGTHVEETSDDVLDSLQDARSPQPVLLLVRRATVGLANVLDEGRPGAPLLVVAHGVQDPGNLGGILRTADAAGATGFVATGHGADLFHPRTIRATMGSIYRIPCATADVEAVLAALPHRGVIAVATEADRGVPFDLHDFRVPTALLFGNEGGGLGEEIAERCQASVRIPMRPGVESLSVGAAAAVLLFEAARQRRRPET